MYHAQTFVGDPYRNTTYNMYLPQNWRIKTTRRQHSNQTYSGWRLYEKVSFSKLRCQESPHPDNLRRSPHAVQYILQWLTPMISVSNFGLPRILASQVTLMHQLRWKRRGPILAQVWHHQRPCDSLCHQTASLHKASRPRAMVCHCLVKWRKKGVGANLVLVGNEVWHLSSGVLLVPGRARWQHTLLSKMAAFHTFNQIRDHAPLVLQHFWPRRQSHRRGRTDA